jgi:hypothetical protein
MDAHQERVKEQLEVARRTIRDLGTDFYRCDPQDHVENVTYVRVTDFLQGYIENEVDMNKDATCTNTCGDYGNGWPATRGGCFEGPKLQFCSKQRTCGGRIFDCKFVDADAWVCMSPQPFRRYGEQFSKDE